MSSPFSSRKKLRAFCAIIDFGKGGAGRDEDGEIFSPARPRVNVRRPPRLRGASYPRAHRDGVRRGALARRAGHGRIAAGPRCLVASPLPWRHFRFPGRTLDVRARGRIAGSGGLRSGVPSAVLGRPRLRRHRRGRRSNGRLRGRVPGSRSAVVGVGRGVSPVPWIRHRQAARDPAHPGASRRVGRRRGRPARRRLRRRGPGGPFAMGLTLPPEEGSVGENEPLARFTTWRIGGPARFFCRVRTESGLARVLAAASSDGLPLALLGMGSNILVADAGFPGYVLRLEGDFLKVSIEGPRLTAGGGAALGGVCAAAARAGLSGIEAISGIPSSIGGAVRINAGAYGGEIFDVLETVRLVSRSGERRAVEASQIRHGYRNTELVESR